ncbi:ImmA/IrrE family metallo-endopeptidase [Patescibacteria group bacterium]|nr:ImmA/IrrE family metallo-endopeptidase [Patescibacteria group bacterium]
MSIKVIKNDQDYQEALQLVGELMDKNPAVNTPDSETLELLTVLIEDYENSVFGETIPDPIDALVFRMEQQNLSADDLVPYIGSRSKVSEVLSRKRPLSINMMKSLQDGLGIPAKVLLNQSRGLQQEKTDFLKLPIKEMLKRGYISAKNFEYELATFFNQLNGEQNILALASRTHYIRSHKPMNPQAFTVWVARLLNRASEIREKVNFNHSKITQALMRSVVDLSDEEDGIIKAIDLLNSVGVIVIVEPHMPKTYLDGAVIMIPGKNPVIGMTIRHDRLDNFWFTLLHELAHIALHYGKGTSIFYDDTEYLDVEDSREKEADKLALEVMIPTERWKDSAASIVPSPDAAIMLASELSIHPSIVAGRMRRERQHYYFLNTLIGKGEARKSFSDINWS